MKIRTLLACFLIFLGVTVTLAADEEDAQALLGKVAYQDLEGLKELIAGGMDRCQYPGCYIWKHGAHCGLHLRLHGYRQVPHICRGRCQHAEYYVWANGSLRSGIQFAGTG